MFPHQGSRDASRKTAVLTNLRVSAEMPGLAAPSGWPLDESLPFPESHVSTEIDSVILLSRSGVSHPGVCLRNTFLQSFRLM